MNAEFIWPANPTCGKIDRHMQMIRRDADMPILIFFVSLIPVILIYRWLKKRREDKEYQHICACALKRGATLCVLLVLVFSAICYVIERLLVAAGAGDLLTAIFRNFIVLALAEETAKYLMLKGLLKKHPYPYAWVDITSLMMIVGMGFGITESLAYAFGANAGMMLIRGITAMHCGYGFVMGYFVGKGKKTGEKKYTVLGFLISFLLHGTYDCCLSDTLGAISEDFAYVSLALAAAALVTLIVSIVHIHKAGKNEKYIERLPLGSAAEA